jgi:hypothetical protein
LEDYLNSHTRRLTREARERSHPLLKPLQRAVKNFAISRSDSPFAHLGDPVAKSAAQRVV